MTLPMHRKSVQCMIGVCDWDYHRHCEERSDAPQGGLSCPFGAIHLLAIRISCGAMHRPAPEGPERKRIATSACGLLAMTEVDGNWFLWFDRAIVRLGREGHDPPLQYVLEFLLC